MSPADASAFRQALTAVDTGKSEEAEPVLRRLVERYPGNDKVNEALGLIYAEAGDLTRAVPYLQRACSDAPQSALDSMNLGSAWLKLGTAREAVVALNTSVRLDPRNAKALSELGQAYMLLHRPADAAQAFARAAAIQPRASDLLYNWAVALADSGQLRPAMEALDRIPADEMSTEADSLAGDLEEKLGNSLAAVHHYQRAVANEPSEANLYALCVEYLRHWTWDEAKRTASYGMAKYPDSTRLKLVLGVALFGSKDFAEAARAFGGLLQRDPDNSMYADMLGRTCGEIGSADSECAALEQFANRHPENAMAAWYAARQILNRPHSAAELDEAEMLLHRATSANPGMADAWYEMGVLDAERQRWDESSAALQKAIALRPSFASAHYQLANAYGHLNRPEDRKKELILFQTCSRKEKDDVNARVREMTVFLTKPQ